MNTWLEISYTYKHIIYFFYKNAMVIKDIMNREKEKEKELEKHRNL